MKISDLQDKTIINITTGKEIGRISDLEINNEGVVVNFYAMKKRSVLNFFETNEEIIFKTNNIKKIGEDVILVEID